MSKSNDFINKIIFKSMVQVLCLYFMAIKLP